MGRLNGCAMRYNTVCRRAWDELAIWRLERPLQAGIRGKAPSEPTASGVVGRTWLGWPCCVMRPVVYQHGCLYEVTINLRQL